ncbi:MULTISPECIES: hypothetical protein [Moorena]|uniref:Uncharacterized protein n=2 Tax=Moorena producens TaxID=1155739 RepID=A0A9Q9SSX0_MOOP1|nr:MULTISPECIES: hypothetical protein [Moorena]EGJ30970.1 hypothetical protein LYNGBM3L_44170 [Moorena producens 3L]NEP66022.1 hypothetical protein [Moorena sp. SIO3A5]NER86738.1 hypothetical protein [Moorena sp. SIO3A2]WAN69055.1 hypothetical protein BJP36_42635 [Moorena producens JHB]
MLVIGCHFGKIFGYEEGEAVSHATRLTVGHPKRTDILEERENPDDQQYVDQ